MNNLNNIIKYMSLRLTPVLAEWSLCQKCFTIYNHKFCHFPKDTVDICPYPESSLKVRTELLLIFWALRLFVSSSEPHITL